MIELGGRERPEAVWRVRADKWRAVDVEDERDGDEQDGNTTEEGGRPLDAETVEHLLGEEGEAGAGERAKEGIGSEGRGGTGNEC